MNGDEHLIEMAASSHGSRGAGGAKSKLASAASVDAREVSNFEALATEWWDPDGRFRPLHRFNPVRIKFIRDHATAHFGRSATDFSPFDGLKLLDIGTGGGLVAEPMRRLGAEVTGIDPSEKNIAIAQAHVTAMGLDVTYRATTAEHMAAQGARFDIVLALEVVEHVADIAVFLEAAAELVKPGGIFFAATLNRTARAYALAIVGAEYVMGWLPRGTHDWNKFVTPGELTTAVEGRGLRVNTVSGLSYNPLTRAWRLGTDTAVNYIIAAEKSA